MTQQDAEHHPLITQEIKHLTYYVPEQKTILGMIRSAEDSSVKKVS